MKETITRSIRTTNKAALSQATYRATSAKIWQLSQSVRFEKSSDSEGGTVFALAASRENMVAKVQKVSKDGTFLTFLHKSLMAEHPWDDPIFAKEAIRECYARHGRRMPRADVDKDIHEPNGCRLEIAKLQHHPKSRDYIDYICETEGRTLGKTKSGDRYTNATDGDYQLLHT